MGYYNGLLMLSKLEEDIFVIKATQDINDNTPLFGIGGEAVCKDYIIKKKRFIYKDFMLFHIL